MDSKDFAEYGITKITEKMIRDTGANFDVVSLDLIRKLDRFAHECPVGIILLFNGMTSAGHTSPLHARGYAVDIAFTVDSSKVKIYELWKLAIEIGFKGVGVYWNGKAYSMHLDTRSALSFWAGRRNPGYDSKIAGSPYWIYTGIFLDPRV